MTQHPEIQQYVNNLVSFLMSEATMTQHTPGPWHIHSDGSIRNISNEGIATVFYIFPKALGDANAKLIAAVPELLEGLEDMFAMLDEGLLVRDISTDNESGWSLKALDIVERLKTAQQAIAKAKGTES